MDHYYNLSLSAISATLEGFLINLSLMQALCKLDSICKAGNTGNACPGHSGSFGLPKIEFILDGLSCSSSFDYCAQQMLGEFIYISLDIGLVNS